MHNLPATEPKFPPDMSGPSGRCRPPPSTNSRGEQSAGRAGQLPPGAVIAPPQMCLWLVYTSQGTTAFVFPFSSSPNKKTRLEVLRLRL